MERIVHIVWKRLKIPHSHIWRLCICEGQGTDVPLICSAAQSSHTCQQCRELCSCSRVGPSRSLLPGAVCLQVSPSTQKCSKKFWLYSSNGDSDGFTLTSPLHSALTLWFAGKLHRNHCRNVFISTQTWLCIMQALTAANSTSLQVAHLIYITICLMALKTAQRSGLTAVSPGFKFPCKTCKYLLLTSTLLF